MQHTIINSLRDTVHSIILLVSLCFEPSQPQMYINIYIYAYIYVLKCTHGHLTREPASVICDNEQGEIFYCADPHIFTQEPALATAITGKTWERFLGKKLR